MKLGIAYCASCGKAEEVIVSEDPSASEHLRRRNRTLCGRCGDEVLVGIFPLGAEQLIGPSAHQKEIEAVKKKAAARGPSD